ncbi:MAG TPA: hypothetical protein VEX13_03330 [Chloroflexia bacterium]|nr:hypothetical protein [Chloroflexia bacterium]
MFEQHPEYAGTPNEVLLKLVGQTFYDRRFKNGPPKDQAANPDNTLTFKETGHSIGGKFRAYWEKHGGLAQQGYPMTDEFKMVSTDGKEYTTQIFQRAVFELHPEFAGSENEVLLRLLGVEELEEANKPAATATPVAKEPTLVPATPTPQETNTPVPVGGRLLKIPEYDWFPGFFVDIPDTEFTNEERGKRDLFNNWISSVSINSGISVDEVKRTFANKGKISVRLLIKDPNTPTQGGITPVIEAPNRANLSLDLPPMIITNGKFPDGATRLEASTSGLWFTVGVDTGTGQFYYANNTTDLADNRMAGLQAGSIGRGLAIFAHIGRAKDIPYAPPDSSYITQMSKYFGNNAVPGINKLDFYGTYDPAKREYDYSMLRKKP